MTYIKVSEDKDQEAKCIYLKKMWSSVFESPAIWEADMENKSSVFL